MLWAAIAIPLVLLAALIFWWLRRRRRFRLIAFVALVREPVSFDSAVIARVAGKAWNADLGDGTSEGADGFVGGAGPMNTIVHDNRMFLINCFPEPYADEPEKAAEGIGDLRIRSLFREHRAWFSCDAMGVDHTTPEGEILEWYRRLGKLFVELQDDNCLLIYLPDSSLAYPITGDTEAALRSENPIEALQETLTLPIIEVDSGDPA